MEETTRNILIEKLKNLGKESGCYLWKDQKGEVIYVGKAIKLESRIRSYLNPNLSDKKTQFLQSEIADLDWVVTQNETDALILEATLIKKHNPRYNVRLKDDKRYPFISVSLSEMYPMVFLTRKARDNGDKYFGPFTDVQAARNTLELIHKIFPIRKTKLKLPQSKPLRPCLNFHMGRCLGPCQGNVSPEEYKKVVDQVLKFLEGNKDNLIQEIKLEMQKASDALEFERAIHLRNRIDSIQKTRQKQMVVSIDGGDEDIVALAVKENEGQILVLEVREGRLESKKTFPFTGLLYASVPEIIEAFLRDYYLKLEKLPGEIVLPIAAKKEYESFLQALQIKNGFLPKLKFPSSGRKMSMLRLAEKNAELSLTERILATKFRDRTDALRELKENLNLLEIPRIIECYDISHFQGKEPVASGVMFVDGKPLKSGYRHYRMRGYDGINDPGMMHEVLGRRLTRLLNEGGELPHLIIIDGGLTQLQRAAEVAQALELGNLAMVGLAKKREEIYFPGEKNPYSFDKNSPMMRLMRNIRDEAHRFGVTYQRLRRTKVSFRSILDEIPDIGLKRKKTLLRFFYSHPDQNAISTQDLLSLEGIGPVLAEKIVKTLKNRN